MDTLDAVIFKAYDIRGVVPSQLDERAARRLGEAFVQCRLLQPGPVVIGQDARSSSPQLADAFSAGVRSQGVDVIDIGLCTTPMLYFAVSRLAAAGGVMVTASHNPAEYNGFKLVRDHSIPIGSQFGLEQLRDAAERQGASVGGVAGRLFRRELLQDYVDFFASRFSFHTAPHLIIDTGNGAAGAVLPPILDALGLSYTPLFFEPDPSFPNHQPDPMKEANLEALRRALSDDDHTHAVGVAFDGDGDRACFVDEEGRTVRGDLTTALLARQQLARSDRPHGSNKILYDLRSSRSVPEAIRAAGGDPIRTRVGHAFIKQQMRKESAIFAGELSGHFYFQDFFYCESAIYAMLELLCSLKGESLARAAASLGSYAHSGEINYHVVDAADVMAHIARRFQDQTSDELDGLSIYGDTWWFNLRASNTEPVVRLNLEAETDEEMQEHVDDITKLLEARGGERITDD